MWLRSWVVRIRVRIRVRVRFRLRVMHRVRVRVRLRLKGEEYFLRLHTPSSTIGLDR